MAALCSHIRITPAARMATTSARRCSVWRMAGSVGSNKSRRWVIGISPRMPATTSFHDRRVVWLFGVNVVRFGLHTRWVNRLAGLGSKLRILLDSQSDGAADDGGNVVVTLGLMQHLWRLTSLQASRITPSASDRRRRSSPDDRIFSLTWFWIHTTDRNLVDYACPVVQESIVDVFRTNATWRHCLSSAYSCLFQVVSFVFSWRLHRRFQSP